MTFLRSAEYHVQRFHALQEVAWLGYKAGLDLVLPWGRRSGKSDLAIEILIEDIETHGQDCLYVAKTQKQARKIVWKKLRRRLRDNKEWKLREGVLEAEHIPTGASIYLYGADIVPDNMTGSGYRVIVCDEYALWKKPEIVQQILSPMLGDFNGQIIFASTKRGKNHFYKLHVRARANPQKYLVVEATIFDNTFLTDEGRAKVLSEYEGGEKNPLYKQEILNQYVVFEGQVFALPLESYTEKRWDAADLDHSMHWRGMDHGYSPDPTACVWIAYNVRKGYFQVYSTYKQHALLIGQHADVIRAQEKFPVYRTHSDIDPQVMAEYEAVGLPMDAAVKTDKKARLLRLVNALRTGKVKIAHGCTPLLDEMASLTWEQVEKESGEDHCVDAFDYGFNSLSIPQRSDANDDDDDDDFPDRRSLNRGQQHHQQDFDD